MATAPKVQPPRIRGLTVEDYMALPGEHSEYELLYGELMMSPSYDFPHSQVAGFIFSNLYNFVTAGNLGFVGWEVDCILANNVVLRPDIHFISNRNLGIIKGHIYGPVDLAIEITSPGDWQFDVYEKRDAYERYGVREYLVFDIAEGRNRAYQWYARGGLFHGGLVETPILKSRVLRGFSLKLAKIWESAGAFNVRKGPRSKKRSGPSDRLK